MTSREIRQQFLDFFRSKDHAIVPSASVVPTDDPTLMFTNAGMNQFKDVFLGTGTRSYTRAADTQKCIRVSGKHNDLEEVGRSLYHHTFFEMLGNWSFGDYFKREAIAWAWELLTEVWGLPKNRLHATVFGGDAAEGLGADEEAEQFWKEVTDINPAHISRHSKKDNFWEMGAVGPCGPCSEIHIDLTPDASGASLVNTGDPGVIELWNLVFIQFNRDADGKLNELPAKHVDTGMGFERLCALLQDKQSNYDTDVFAPLFGHLERITGIKYGGKVDNNVDVAFRVIADHVRMLTFSIADQAKPGNEGRGYVLRRLLRRAARFGWQYLDQHDPFIYQLVHTLVETMSDVFPEIARHARRVKEIIRDEEESFGKTLERGIKLFNQEADYAFHRAMEQRKEIAYELRPGEKRDDSARRHPVVIPGGVAFVLHDTYGFSIDMTQQMAAERGQSVDVQAFEKLMQEAREKSRAGTSPAVTSGIDSMAWKQHVGKSEFVGYDALQCEARILGTVQTESGTSFGAPIYTGEGGILVLDRTPFYAEKGGQAGDVGIIISPSGQFKVEDTREIDGVLAHIGRCIEGEIWQFSESALNEPLPHIPDSDTFEGVPLSQLPPENAELAQTHREMQEHHLRLERGRREPVHAIVDSDKRHSTMRNHTATHLAHWALRQVLGDGVTQQGSVVDDTRLRFDFDHRRAMTREEIEEVERLVNAKVYANLPVNTRVLPTEEAKNLPGVRAFFGEKYGDEVRVVEIGDGFSREFCGGTHLSQTGEIGLFKIVSEEAVAKGVRRLVAVTGRGAVEYVTRMDRHLREAASMLNTSPDQLTERVAALQKEVKTLKKKAASGAVQDIKSLRADLAAGSEALANGNLVVAEVPDVPVPRLRELIDWLRADLKTAAIFLGTRSGGKALLMASFTDDLVAQGLKAGDLVREIAPIVGGSGGGKPTLAQAGGKDPDAVPEALERAKKLLRERLGGLGR